jgi:hypothetical protein
MAMYDELMPCRLGASRHETFFESRRHFADGHFCCFKTHVLRLAEHHTLKAARVWIVVHFFSSNDVFDLENSASIDTEGASFFPEQREK